MDTRQLAARYLPVWSVTTVIISSAVVEQLAERAQNAPTQFTDTSLIVSLNNSGIEITQNFV